MAQSSSSGGGKASAQKTTDQALKSERNEPSQDEIRQRDDATSAVGKDTPGVVEDPSGVLAPAENAPGPAQPVNPAVGVADVRPRIEPKDRGVFIGAAVKRDADVDTKGDEVEKLFAKGDGDRDEESAQIKGKPVDWYRVLVAPNSVTLMTNNGVQVFDREMGSSFVAAVHAGRTNMVS